MGVNAEEESPLVVFTRLWGLERFIGSSSQSSLCLPGEKSSRQRTGFIFPEKVNMRDGQDIGDRVGSHNVQQTTRCQEGNTINIVLPIFLKVGAKPLPQGNHTLTHTIRSLPSNPIKQ